MKAKKWASLVVVGGLALPLGAYAQETPGKGTSGTERGVRATANDAAITAKVKTQLIKDKDVSAMNINVDTMNGVVTLKGNAKNRAEADKAATLARSVEGVRSVKNDIQVSAADASRPSSTGASTKGSPKADGKSSAY